MDWKGLIALHRLAQSWTLTQRLVLGNAHCRLCRGRQLTLRHPVQAVKVSFLH